MDEEDCNSKDLNDDELLDPRIQAELEKLNTATETINSLEQQLERSRAIFRQHLTDSTHKLNELMKKLGTSVEKARPYYEARIKAKEAQAETQSAAQRFERACSQLTAAKEMVHLAEQGFFCKGQPFDPAWQEMLNHATMKVNDAEKERLESEVEHKQTAFYFNEIEKEFKYLQKELRRPIAKSKPYFEMKARFIQQMEAQKQHVSALEETVRAAKQTYANTLKNLEAISDSVHQQREEAKLRRELGSRGAGVGTETPDPPPERSEVFLDTGQHKVICSPKDSPDFYRRSHSAPMAGSSASQTEEDNTHAGSFPGVKVRVTEESDTDLPEPSESTTQSNAAVMADLQKAKGVKGQKSLLVPKRKSQDDLLDEVSDNDSQSESIASQSVLDDDQIQSLMLECPASDYSKFIARMDSRDSKKYKRMSLPIKLSYLENYMTFKPIWDNGRHANGSPDNSSDKSSTESSHQSDDTSQGNHSATQEVSTGSH